MYKNIDKFIDFFIIISFHPYLQFSNQRCLPPVPLHPTPPSLAVPPAPLKTHSPVFRCFPPTSPSSRPHPAP